MKHVTETVVFCVMVTMLYMPIAFKKHVQVMCTRQCHLREINRKLQEMDSAMKRQLKVIKGLRKTCTRVLIWTGLAFSTFGCSKVIEIPVECRRCHKETPS